jgi:hypothetical protein
MNRADSLLIRPGILQSNLRTILTVRLLPRPTKLAIKTHIIRRLNSRPVPYLPVRHIGSKLDDDAGALMARGTHAEDGHLGDWEVIEHVVDV